MDGTALYEAVAAIYIAQATGVILSFGQVILIRRVIHPLFIYFGNTDIFCGSLNGKITASRKAEKIKIINLN